MAISMQNNGNGTTTVSLSYTATTQRITDTLTDAAQYLYESGIYPLNLTEGGAIKPEFETLTQGEIGQIIDYFVQKSLKDAARNQYLKEAVAAAKQIAQNETGMRYL